MSKPALEDLKKRFQEQKNQKKEGGNRRNSDYYEFWNMQDDEMASIRTLEIANQKGAMPVLEKDHHKISIEGKDEIIPCIAMYGEVCPICELSKKYYAMARAEKNNDEAKKELEKKGKYYYRNRSYLMSAYVRKDPLPVDTESGENSEGKQKVIQFGNQLYKKYNASLEALISADEIDDVPWSLENGLDFNIVKKNGGQFAKWDLASDFARRSTPLPDEFVANFEAVDLTKYLPANPGLDKVQRMLDAHMNDGSYSDNDDASDNTPIEKVKEEKVLVKNEVKTEVKQEPKEEKPEVIKEAPASSDEGEDDEIAAMLRQLKNRVSAD